MKPKKLLFHFILGILALAPILSSCENELTEVANSTPPPTVNDSSRVSASAASRIAAIFAGKNGSTITSSRSSDDPIQTINDSDGQPLAYIVNQENGGWVIVSASTDFYPILAYSDEGLFTLNSHISDTGLGIWINQITNALKASPDDLDKETSSQIAIEWSKYAPALQTSSIGGPLPGGNSPEAIACRARLKELNDNYYQSGWTFTTLSNISGIPFPNDVYSLADTHSSSYEYTIVGLREIGKHNVGPLMTTQWYQQEPYGYSAPNHIAGCLPTAMGQIMRFHRYPSSYDWDNMPDYIVDTSSLTIPNFLLDLGIKVEANYEVYYTSAATMNAQREFSKMGYNALLEDHYNSHAIQFLEEEQSPVLMRGQSAPDSGIGHAWVCDGVRQTSCGYEYYVEYLVNGAYDNLNASWLDSPLSVNLSVQKPPEFHMNWGEKELANGWFIDATASNDSYFNYHRRNIYATPNY